MKNTKNKLLVLRVLPRIDFASWGREETDKYVEDTASQTHLFKVHMVAPAFLYSNCDSNH